MRKIAISLMVLLLICISFFPTVTPVSNFNLKNANEYMRQTKTYLANNSADYETLKRMRARLATLNYQADQCLQ